MAPPVFQEIAVKAGLEGNTLCKFLISEDGKVSNIQVIKGQEIFRQAGIDAVKQFVFTPAELESHRISIWVILQINFGRKMGAPVEGVLG